MDTFSTIFATAFATLAACWCIFCVGWSIKASRDTARERLDQRFKQVAADLGRQHRELQSDIDRQGRALEALREQLSRR